MSLQIYDFSDILCHDGHKYVAKIKVGGQTRYFYSQEAYDAYMKGGETVYSLAGKKASSKNTKGDVKLAAAHEEAKKTSIASVGKSVVSFFNHLFSKESADNFKKAVNTEAAGKDVKKTAKEVYKDYYDSDKVAKSDKKTYANAEKAKKAADAMVKDYDSEEQYRKKVEKDAAQLSNKKEANEWTNYQTATYKDTLRKVDNYNKASETYENTKTATGKLKNIGSAIVNSVKNAASSAKKDSEANEKKKKKKEDRVVEHSEIYSIDYFLG